jgi:hypothetical protein
MKKLSSAKKSESVSRIFVCSYGVKIEIQYDVSEFSETLFIEILKKILPTGFEIISSEDVEHHFGVFTNDRDGKQIFELHHEFEKIAAAWAKDEILDYLESRIRLTVAEFAKDRVFLHAGVVGWKGRAIVLPGKSFHGKTTLVSELIRKGADYYSDEYAVLDDGGFVHPFPKMLSVRGIIDDIQQVDLPVENFGGKAAVEPLEVGMILLTEFEKKAVWNPVMMSPGEGILEIISHTIPIRYKPEFSLKVLNKITNRAIITKSQRGEAIIFADLILDFFERQVIESLS